MGDKTRHYQGNCYRKLFRRNLSQFYKFMKQDEPLKSKYIQSDVTKVGLTDAIYLLTSIIIIYLKNRHDLYV